MFQERVDQMKSSQKRPMSAWLSIQQIVVLWDVPSVMMLLVPEGIDACLGRERGRLILGSVQFTCTIQC